MVEREGNKGFENVCNGVGKQQTIVSMYACIYLFQTMAFKWDKEGNEDLMVRDYEKMVGQRHFEPQEDKMLAIVEVLVGISWKDRILWLEMCICESEIMEALQLVVMTKSRVISVGLGS